MSDAAFWAGWRWYVQRLRMMGCAEVVHRIGEQWSLKVMQVRQSRDRARSLHARCDADRFVFCAGSQPMLPELPLKSKWSSKEAEDLLSGTINALGFECKWKSDGMMWHQAPDTGRLWPQSFFGSISYRMGNPYGDVRVAWEPSRLQHLVALGLLIRHGVDEVGDRAVRLLEDQFLSWVAANPPLKGIHYISTMECGLRILAVCHALDLARERLCSPDRIWPALLDLIESHAGLIFKRPSFDSSCGNHSIAESAGLVYAGVLFPEFGDAREWRDLGLSILEAEAGRQVLGDGGGIEQSLWYQRFILDLYGLVTELLIHAGHPVAPVIRDALSRGRRFLKGLAGGVDRLPAIGDGDNGYALSPFLQFSSERENWVPGLVTFPEAGYSAIRTEERALLVLDHGPLGMAPANGHGHADALSVLIRVEERELLIDPGTYTYSGDARWRAYFRGTAAHNTVTVDGQDQAVQEASFIWSRPFQCRLVRSETTPDGTIRLLAYHTGYLRLNEGVLHWRALVFRPMEGWLIWDYLHGEGSHTLDLHWHLGGHLGVEPDGGAGSFVLTGPPLNVRLSVSGGEISTHFGESDPILGWRSRLYGLKEPIMTIRCRFEGMLPHRFLTEIAVGEGSWNDFSTSEDLSVLQGWIDEFQASSDFRRTGRLRVEGGSPRSR